MLSGISLTCFTASYLVALVLSVSRLFFRLSIRVAVMAAFTGAGLFAQTVYLYSRARQAMPNSAPLSGWYDWCLLASWVLVAVYLLLMLGRPETSYGLFLLPLALALIGAAYFAKDLAPFPRPSALYRWQMIHGIALLLATIVVALGFAAGVMYLIQSYRLKHKLPARVGFKLPSLEWLQRLTARALWFSAVFLGIGLLSGIVLNWVRHAKGELAIPWSDPVVWSSSVLFLWVIVSTLFELAYKPARQGRKIAYLTVASFLFLVLVLMLVLFSGSNHTRRSATVSQLSIAPIMGGVL